MHLLRRGRFRRDGRDAAHLCRQQRAAARNLRLGVAGVNELLLRVCDRRSLHVCDDDAELRLSSLRGRRRPRVLTLPRFFTRALSPRPRRAHRGAASERAGRRSRQLRTTGCERLVQYPGRPRQQLGLVLDHAVLELHLCQRTRRAHDGRPEQQPGCLGRPRRLKGCKFRGHIWEHSSPVAKGHWPDQFQVQLRAADDLPGLRRTRGLRKCVGADRVRCSRGEGAQPVPLGQRRCAVRHLRRHARLETRRLALQRR